MSRPKRGPSRMKGSSTLNPRKPAPKPVESEAIEEVAKPKLTQISINFERGTFDPREAAERYRPGPLLSKFD